MSRESYKMVSGGKNYQVLEFHNLINDYGLLSIIKDSQGKFYVIQEGQPDRGSPYMNYWEISEEDYLSYQTPTLDTLKRLFSINFFDATLFDAFLKREENQAVLNEILKVIPKPEIENAFVQNWFDKNRIADSDALLFQEVSFLRETTLSGIINAVQFINEDLLIADILEMNTEKKAYEIKRNVIGGNKLEIIQTESIAWDDGLPFFTFAKDFPIKPVIFGDQKQYVAQVLNQDDHRAPKIIAITEGDKLLFEYEYPRSANLGRFWVFNEEETRDEFKNSVLFMYSIRDHQLVSDYMVMRFEINNGIAKPKTKINIFDDSRVSFNPNGLIAYCLPMPGGGRSNRLAIAQL